jgi:hypothetical protein
MNDDARNHEREDHLQIYGFPWYGLTGKNDFREITAAKSEHHTKQIWTVWAKQSY